ncbi:hypothetical protein FB451DRAFT_1443581 [Mycena latifolia]|nr:hypothetical protein FB451DRAFT_1443581 [Mycena latifolia]
MAAPFVFVPEASSSTPYPASAYPQFYPSPQGGGTPFLPPSPLLYPSSPFLRPADSPSGSPNAFNPNSVLWPEDAGEYMSPYTAGWIPLAPRQRPNSWAGPALAPGSPFVPPKAPAFLHANSNPFFKPGHKKARSWGALPAWLPGTDAPQIHPWLNGDAPAVDAFFFDLAPAAFVPLRALSATQSARVSDAELHAPGFKPSRTALRILHPRLPFWPVDLRVNAPSLAPPPPIAFGDVLAALHHALHARISPADWAALSEEDVRLVTRAFAQRCRAEAVRSGVPPAALHDREVAVRSEGVKRVDFLLGKTVFRGLVRAPGDPEGVVRLVTA